MSKERINQTVKFLKWTKKYNGWWQLICEPGNEHMDIQKMQMLNDLLISEWENGNSSGTINRLVMYLE